MHCGHQETGLVNESKGKFPLSLFWLGYCRWFLNQMYWLALWFKVFCDLSQMCEAQHLIWVPWGFVWNKNIADGFLVIFIHWFSWELIVEINIVWLWSKIFALEFLEGLFGQQSGNRGNHHPNTTQYSIHNLLYIGHYTNKNTNLKTQKYTQTYLQLFK